MRNGTTILAQRMREKPQFKSYEEQIADLLRNLDRVMRRLSRCERPSDRYRKLRRVEEQTRFKIAYLSDRIAARKVDAPAKPSGGVLARSGSSEAQYPSRGGKRFERWSEGPQEATNRPYIKRAGWNRPHPISNETINLK